MLSLIHRRKRRSPCTLAVPKIFCGMRLEYFDRGAKPYSLFRPLGALRRLCPLGRLLSGVPVWRNGSNCFENYKDNVNHHISINFGTAFIDIAFF